MASTWAAVTAAMGSGKGIPSSARTAISTAWAIRERSKGATRPSRLRTSLPMNRPASSSRMSSPALPAPCSESVCSCYLCSVPVRGPSRALRSSGPLGNGHAGCLAGSDGDDGGTPGTPAAPGSEPGTTTEPTAVPADDDFTRDRARGCDEERRRGRVSRSPAHDALEDAAHSPAGPSRGGPGHIHALARAVQCARAWLSGRSSGLWADRSRFAWRDRSS